MQSPCCCCGSDVISLISVWGRTIIRKSILTASHVCEDMEKTIATFCLGQWAKSLTRSDDFRNIRAVINLNQSNYPLTPVVLWPHERQGNRCVRQTRYYRAMRKMSMRLRANPRARMHAHARCRVMHVCACSLGIANATRVHRATRTRAHRYPALSMLRAVLWVRARESFFPSVSEDRRPWPGDHECQLIRYISVRALRYSVLFHTHLRTFSVNACKHDRGCLQSKWCN